MTTAELPPPILVTLPPLHASQRIIAKHPARFKVACCGRRWGKNVVGVVLCVRKAAKGGRVWWVAPSYSLALEGWAYLIRIARQFPGARILTSRLKVVFAGGGSIEIKTADNPDNLRGAGLDLAVLDEAASMKPEVWDLIIRPALADHQGEALFISTPQHYNWFFDLYQRAEADTTGTWAAWQHPTWDNPFIPAAEIEAAQRDMAPEDFDQEFGASFTAVGGAIFPLLSANRPMYLRPFPPGILDFRRIGVGMDWGTTPQHKAADVAGGVLRTGVVWIRSAWESESGSANDWFDEAVRAKRDYGATLARVDRSQSSAKDTLKARGFTDVENGTPNVEARIGDFQGLVRRNAIFFDVNGPGVREYYNHLCAYHRDKDGGVVEEQDDDVDAGCYLVSALVAPALDLSRGFGAPSVSYGSARRLVGG